MYALRQLLIQQALKKSSGNISYPGLIAAWSAKGKTNDDEDRATLKDLTGNGHDITLNGFAFSEMSGYGGYKTNMLNWKYDKNSAVISSSQNTFVMYNTTEISTHFWDYVSAPPLGIIHRPSFKLKISGLNKNEVIYYRYQDGEDFSVAHERIPLYNGINVFPEINAEIVTEKLPYSTVFEIYSQTILNKEITFEILPEYPDALVFDGVDDYGINENVPILTDFTVIAKRKTFKDETSEQKSPFISKMFMIGTGAFAIEGAWIYNNVINFGANNIINYIDNDITFVTKNNYNEQSIISGSFVDNQGICIGAIRPSHTVRWKGAIYSVYLFDRSLDEQEIKAFIRKYIDPEYLLPSEIPTPDCYYDFSQGSNDNENRETIKDYSGNGNDAVAHNFAWSGMSGYGGNLYGNYKYHFDALGKYQSIILDTPIIGNLKFKVTGLTDYFNKTTNYIELKLIRVSDGGADFKEIKEDGEYNIELPTSKYSTISIRSGGVNIEDGTCNIDIEMLPEYEGALVFDGTNDYVSLDAFDSGFKTMFMKFKPVNTINAGYYDQIKKGESKYYFSVSGNSSDIAFSYRNTNGKTYINGILNTSILSKDVVNKTVCIGIVNENVTADNTTIPKIGDGTHFTPWFANMALYKFLGFKEALTEEQIQAVIKKYNLLNGVDEIEVS